ncbi:hypothetical protein F5Y05DRAFT_424807 [Hypoxylon sp. FL0543]|nr:hypothetical protein F5Y05DRAFT_424807 [Hypoxylon sp. FL0543]
MTSTPNKYFPLILPILIATYSAAISLSLPPSLPPSSFSSSSPSSSSSSPSSSSTTNAHLNKQDQRDWTLLEMLRPTPTDLLTAHWALFWRPPIRAVIAVAGRCLRDFLPDAEDLVLSTEL